MFIVRPIAAPDLDQLEKLAQQAAFGLTTLPKDHELLKERIEDSHRAFEQLAAKPRGEGYLFVLEDLETGQILGTTGIVSRSGGSSRIGHIASRRRCSSPRC